MESKDNAAKTSRAPGRPDAREGRIFSLRSLRHELPAGRGGRGGGDASRRSARGLGRRPGTTADTLDTCPPETIIEGSQAAAMEALRRSISTYAQNGVRPISFA